MSIHAREKPHMGAEESKNRNRSPEFSIESYRPGEESIRKYFCKGAKYKVLYINNGRTRYELISPGYESPKLLSHWDKLSTLALQPWELAAVLIFMDTYYRDYKITRAAPSQFFNDILIIYKDVDGWTNHFVIRPLCCQLPGDDEILNNDYADDPSEEYCRLP